MNDVNELVREYYRSKALSSTAAQDILNEGKVLAKWSVRRLAKLATVAAGLLCSVVISVFSFQSVDVTEQVMAEIAMNHEKVLPIEVVADRYEAVTSKLDRLDFPLAPRNTRILSEFTLLGGRYCSIHGALAAQLKLRHARSGQISTLFVTKLTEDLGRVSLRSSILKGVRIQLWKEGGLLFGLAEDAD